MSKLAVLASGNGGNFQALVEALNARPLEQGPRHECALLIYDRRAALAPTRAAKLGIPARYVSYFGRSAAEAEAEISVALEEAGADLVALAGFMRLLSPAFVEAKRGRLVNVHPSILPRWPGTNAIERAYRSGEKIFGVTVHYVDEGMDTGAVIDREKFELYDGETLEEVEAGLTK